MHASASCPSALAHLGCPPLLPLQILTSTKYSLIGTLKAVPKPFTVSPLCSAWPAREGGQGAGPRVQDGGGWGGIIFEGLRETGLPTWLGSPASQSFRGLPVAPSAGAGGFGCCREQACSARRARSVPRGPPAGRQRGGRHAIQVGGHRARHRCWAVHARCRGPWGVGASATSKAVISCYQAWPAIWALPHTVWRRCCSCLACSVGEWPRHQAGRHSEDFGGQHALPGFPGGRRMLRRAYFNPGLCRAICAWGSTSCRMSRSGLCPPAARAHAGWNEPRTGDCAARHRHPHHPAILQGGGGCGWPRACTHPAMCR